MRCPSCEKFVSLEMGDPEVQEINIDTDGTVLVTVRIVRTCADCGDELKEATLEIEHNLPEKDICDHLNQEGEAAQEPHHDLQIEEDGVEPLEESGGRYKKSYFGAEVRFRVTCTCDSHVPEKDRWSLDGHVHDKVAASGMDEMV